MRIFQVKVRYSRWISQVLKLIGFETLKERENGCRFTVGNELLRLLRWKFRDIDSRRNDSCNIEQLKRFIMTLSWSARRLVRRYVYFGEIFGMCEQGKIAICHRGRHFPCLGYQNRHVEATVFMYGRKNCVSIVFFFFFFFRNVPYEFSRKEKSNYLLRPGHPFTNPAYQYFADRENGIQRKPAFAF